MSKIFAIGEIRLIDGAARKKKSTSVLTCNGCVYFSGRDECNHPNHERRVDLPIEKGGTDCDGAIWIDASSAPPAKIAAAWARSAIASLPEMPAVDSDAVRGRMQATRDDVANLLAVLAAEMDAEGGV